MAAPRLLKNQAGKGRGVVIELDGVDGLLKSLAMYPKFLMNGMRDAAKQAGVIIQEEAKANLDKKDVGKRRISVREMTDKAREQIANGSINVKTKLTKQESDSEWLRILKEREKQGKSGKVKKPTHRVKQRKISDFVRGGSALIYGKTGNLKKSIKYKLWSPQARKVRMGKKWKTQASGIVKLMVGPTSIQGAAYNELAGEMQKYNTFNYYHLVEFGHQKVFMGRRLGGMVPAYPFLGPAAKSTRARVSAIARKVLRMHLAMAATSRNPGRRAA